MGPVFWKVHGSAGTSRAHGGARIDGVYGNGGADGPGS